MVIINRFKNYSQNSKIIIQNALGAFVIKGAALLVYILTTPALIKYFNNKEVLGVWFTILSVLIWFLNFDLGIGNGIRNQLVKDIANKDYISARITISSGFFSVGISTVILLIVGMLILICTDLNSLFNVETSLLSQKTLLLSSVAVFIAVMLKFFLTTVTSIFYALQKSVVNNFLALCVSILQLLFVLIFRFDNVEEALIYLSIIFIVLSNLPIFIAGIYIFLKPLKQCRPNITAVTKERIRVILGIGALFFLCQVLYMCIVNINEFLITKLYGAIYTSEFSFYYKIMSFQSMLVMLALTPVWSVVTKAVTEKNYTWLSKLFDRMKVLGMIVIFSQFAIVPFLQFIFDIWLGKGIIFVDFWTSISFACFLGLLAYSTMLSTLANGMARMKVQTICFSIGVLAKLIIDFSLYKIFDNWSLIVWSNVVALLPYIIVQQIDLNKFFKKQYPI